MDLELRLFVALRWLARQDRLSPLLNRYLHPINVFDPQRYIDPYPAYERLRNHGGPVFHQRRAGMWYVSGFEETEEVLRSDASVDRQSLVDNLPPYPELARSTRDLFTRTLLMQDPPDHTRLRKLVNRAFTPRAVAGLREWLTEQTDELIDDLRAEAAVDGVEQVGRVDIMSRFADRLPIYVIGRLLGIDRIHRDRLKTMSEELIRFVDPIYVFEPAEMEAAVADFRSLLADVVAERKARPRDDLISALIEAEEDGDKLSEDELASMVALLMVAGHETTSGLLGTALVALDNDREARRRLIDDPTVLSNAVEELLRFDSPVQTIDRAVVTDLEIGDGADAKTIPAGSQVLVMPGAANRDPRRFKRPDRLMLDRPDVRSVSFGHGPHHCVGAALARLETEIALPSLLRAFPDHRVDHDRVVWKRSTTLRGPIRLPVELTP